MTGTAEDVKLNELPQENARTEKPWTFKKQENGKFKIFEKETGALLEGFEDQEFGSPLEGGRFMHALMADMDQKAKAASLTIGSDIMRKPLHEQEGDTPISKKSFDAGDSRDFDVQDLARKAESTNSDALDEGRERAQIITRRPRMFEIVIPKQSNSDMNRPVYVPTHEGGKDWWIQRGEKTVVPEYVVNILQESIQTQTSYDFENNPQGIKTVASVERIPRFGLQIIREVRV